jgi:hypothetical protein
VHKQGLTIFYRDGPQNGINYRWGSKAKFETNPTLILKSYAKRSGNAQNLEMMKIKYKTQIEEILEFKEKLATGNKLLEKVDKMKNKTPTGIVAEPSAKKSRSRK